MRSQLESCQKQCVELQEQVEFLKEQADSAFKNLENSNKALICELEEKLRREKQDCQELRKQLTVSGTNLTEEHQKYCCCLYLRKVTQRKFCNFLLTVKCRDRIVLVQDWTSIRRVLVWFSVSSGCRFFNAHTLALLNSKA
jgi:hypothetical protein